MQYCFNRCVNIPSPTTSLPGRSCCQFCSWLTFTPATANIIINSHSEAPRKLRIPRVRFSRGNRHIPSSLKAAWPTIVVVSCTSVHSRLKRAVVPMIFAFICYTPHSIPSSVGILWRNQRKNEVVER